MIMFFSARGNFFKTIIAMPIRPRQNVQDGDNPTRKNSVNAFSNMKETVTLPERKFIFQE